MEDKALALFAGKPRIQRDERQLTEAFARMCEGDDALRIGFVRAVLAAVGTRRAKSAARHLPLKGTALVIEPEKSLGPKKKGWFKNSGGRPDLIVSGGGTTIIVEAKVGAGLGDKQLQCYVEHGLVVLVTENTDDGESSSELAWSDDVEATDSRAREGGGEFGDEAETVA